MSRPSNPLPPSSGENFLLGAGPDWSGEPAWSAAPTPPSRRKRRRRSGRRAVLLIVVVLLVGSAAAASVRFLQQGSGEPPAPAAAPPVRTNYCTASAPGSAADAQGTELSPEQAGNAAIIAAVASRRHLPARATAIAIATALQESTLRNLDYGDADSLGLFQQRPSQGWGTRKQVTDPVHAANAFYDALTKVHGYQTLPITKAAQKVQRSAFPKAYAVHGPAAVTIAAALGGSPPASYLCVLPASSASPQTTRSTGVTGRAAALRTAAAEETGARTTHVLAPTVIRFRVPASSKNRRAWALAAWAVARADDLEIVEVRVAGRVWNRAQSAHGWSKLAGGRASDVVIQVS